MQDFNNETDDLFVNSKSTEIKNRLNPYILDRIERLEGGLVTDEWLDEVEAGCQSLIADLNLRKTLARQHLVNYVLEERGITAFGLKEHFSKPKENIDKAIKQINKERKQAE